MTEITTRGDYSQGLWDEVQTYDQWLRFHRHDETIASRQAVYDVLDAWLAEREADWPLSLVEVGFGGAIDYECCFRGWRKRGRIDYTGYEIMPQFAKWAGRRHRGVDFRQGGFLNLKPGNWDVSYTRHTLQHMAPELQESCLRALLRAARRLCIVAWRMPPGEGHVACDWRSWQNTWNLGETRRIIEGEGYSVGVVGFDPERHGEELARAESVWVMRRQAVD
jgi:hypothetical protein